MNYFTAGLVGLNNLHERFWLDYTVRGKSLLDIQFKQYYREMQSVLIKGLRITKPEYFRQDKMDIYEELVERYVELGDDVLKYFEVVLQEWLKENEDYYENFHIVRTGRGVSWVTLIPTKWTNELVYKLPEVSLDDGTLMPNGRRIGF